MHPDLHRAHRTALLEDADIIANDPSDDSGSATDRRWPAVVALIMAWLRPAIAARRTRHVSLRSAWIAHLVAVLATAVAVLLFIAWDEAGGALDGNVFVEAAVGAFSQIARRLSGASAEFLLAVGGIGILIELAHIVLAAVVMPWGARDEALRQSYFNSLRQVWIRTSHIFVIVVVFGFSVVVAERITRLRIEAAVGGELWVPIAPPDLPTVSPDDPGYQQAMDEFDIAQEKYDQLREERNTRIDAWRKSRPWYVEHSEMLPFLLAPSLVLWFLWGLLRSVGARREVVPIARPPTCEACGYNLTAMPMESRCPECGMAVLESLGPDARPGAPWQGRGRAGSFSTWCQTAVMAISRPAELGRQLRAIEPGTDHRVFLAVHLPFVFAVGFLSLMVLALMSGPADAFRDRLPIFLTVMTVFGTACVVGIILFVLLGAVVIGSFEGYRYKRNLLPAAVQVGCYLVTYLVLWEVFGGATGLGVFFAEDAYVFQGLEELTGIYHEFLVVAAWLVPNLVWCVWFFLLLYRGAIGAAYANR